MCCVMPPLSPLTTLMPMMRSKQRRLAVVDVAQERDRPAAAGTRSAGSSTAVLELRQQLVFEALGLREVDVDAQFGGDQLGHVGVDHGVDLGHHVVVHQDALNLRGRDAGRFGELADRAGQLDRDVLFARSGGVGAGAFLPAIVGGADRCRNFFAVDGPHVAATLELTLFATAEHRLASRRLLPARSATLPPRPRRPRRGGRCLPRRASRTPGLPGPLRSFAASSVFSWRRKCAASGLLPSLPPSTSAGSFMSGFWALGSLAAGPLAGLAGAAGIGASLIAGRERSLPEGPSPRLRETALLSVPTIGTLPLRAGADVFVAAHRGGQWAGAARCGGGVLRFRRSGRGDGSFDDFRFRFGIGISVSGRLGFRLLRTRAAASAASASR